MTDNRTTELLCCPFCGGEAEVYEMNYGENGKYSVFGVFCKEDSRVDLIGLSRYQHGHFIDNFPTEAEAIKAWNTRAERTCRVVSSRFEDLVDEWCFELSCGHAIWFSDSEPPRYCHECGAKVVGE